MVNRSTHLSSRIDETKPRFPRENENETLDETWKVAENIHQAIRSWGGREGGREMGGGPINLKALSHMHDFEARFASRKVQGVTR